MATWVGLFVNHVEEGSVRIIEVKANSEIEALTELDFYDYDENWKKFSFVEVYKKSSVFSICIVALKQDLLQYQKFWYFRFGKKYTNKIQSTNQLKFFVGKIFS